MCVDFEEDNHFVWVKGNNLCLLTKEGLVMFDQGNLVGQSPLLDLSLAKMTNSIADDDYGVSIL